MNDKTVQTVWKWVGLNTHTSIIYTSHLESGLKVTYIESAFAC